MDTTHRRSCKDGFAIIVLLLVALFSNAAHGQDSLPVLVGNVTKIEDGDTIDLQLSSGPIRVRLHGIDMPERGQPGAKEATAARNNSQKGTETIKRTGLNRPEIISARYEFLGERAPQI
jgi:hypothetical protein